MRIPSPLVLVALLLFGVANEPSAQQILGQRDVHAIRADSVFRAFDRTDAPGCALGVYRHGTTLYARGYGMASLELGVPITPRTVFDVGSVSKQFTAMSILLLAKDGKLSIDDAVRKYVPELPAYADRVTIRQLLSHTSGLRDHFGLLEAAGRSFEGTADTVDFLRLITRSAEPNFEPGTRYLYSNSGFVLLSTIVYRVSGKSLATFAAERIFTPLGMTDTRLQDDHSLVIPGRATAYQPRGAQWAVRMSQFDGMAGAGGLHTSVEDFQRWIRNYDDAAVGGRETIAAMLTPTRLRNDSVAFTGPEAAYGLGVSVGTHRGLRVNSHSGVWAGYRADFERFPDQDLTVATFCNFTTAGPDSLARRVAAIYLSKEMGPDVATERRAALLGAPRVTLSAAELAPLEGAWRNELLGEVRRTELAGDTLVLIAGTRIPLVPLSARRFRGAPASEVRFRQDSAGQPARMLVTTGATEVAFTRVAPQASTVGLAEYAASYFSAEVDARYDLRLERDTLALWRDGRRVGAVEPAYRDVFMRGTSAMTFTRDGKGHVNGFLLEAGRVRHLRFTRTADR